MAGVSDENRQIAKYLRAAFGGAPKVARYWDEANRSCVDVLTSEGQPQPGVSSFATIGLSDVPLMRDGREYPARVELVGACASATPGYGNMLATAAFCVINSQWFCGPGEVFPDVVSMYGASHTMKHLFFVPPFLWEDRLQTLTLPSKTVAWLLAVPISEAERLLAVEHGADRLEERFEAEQIDLYDLDRPSVV
jgi:antitoxin YqcF